MQPSAIAARILSVGAISERLLAPLTIFLGATLLFAVEPMIAKMILPWFGGSSEVWIVCLLFFQTALLAGYLYAHLLTTRMDARWQLRVHLSLLTLSLFLLPVIPSERWKPAGDEEPLLFILGVLASTIGLQFLLLASTGPLVQSWLSQSRSNAVGSSQTIYRLYALSNVGSLLALLLYPVLIEPSMSTSTQGWSWSAAYSFFAVLSAAAAWNYSHRITPEPNKAVWEPPPSTATRVLWFLLAFAPSTLLLAVTNTMLRNIAAIPLLWVVPLALYLLSFILTFDSPRWYYRPLWYTLFAAAVGTMIYYVIGLFLAGSYIAQLAFYAGGMFVCCVVCHGELASLKPKLSHVTAYYLTIASGGAAGGLLIAAVAPIAFNDDYDLALVLPAMALLVILVAWRRLPATLPAWLRWSALVCVLYGWTFVTGHMVFAIKNDMSGILLSLRNFYGPLRVTIESLPGRTDEIIQLRNGNVIHGREFSAPERRCDSISYYAPSSGIGVAIREKAKTGPLKIGVIGLGAGMIAGFGRKDDQFRFYEINPQVRTVATDTFHYLSCPGDHSIAMGDARLSLEREPPQQFDVLAVDAFTSDAIPVHLLTKEAFALFWRHLKPDGVLAVHVSNQYINLAPIVALAARASGKTARSIATREDLANAVDLSQWVLVAARPEFFLGTELKSAKSIETANMLGWTDDYSNLWRALR